MLDNPSLSNSVLCAAITEVAALMAPRNTLQTATVLEWQSNPPLQPK